MIVGEEVEEAKALYLSSLIFAAFIFVFYCLCCDLNGCSAVFGQVWIKLISNVYHVH